MKRFKLFDDEVNGKVGLYEYDDGEVVLYEDCKHIVRQNKELRKALEVEEDRTDKLEHSILGLKAVARASKELIENEISKAGELLR